MDSKAPGLIQFPDISLAFKGVKDGRILLTDQTSRCSIFLFPFIIT